MFSAIRKRMHLSPSMAIAVIALVFAMTGGAFAMSGGGSSSEDDRKLREEQEHRQGQDGPKRPRR